MRAREERQTHTLPYACAAHCCLAALRFACGSAAKVHHEALRLRASRIAGFSLAGALYGGLFSGAARGWRAHRLQRELPETCAAATLT